MNDRQLCEQIDSIGKEVWEHVWLMLDDSHDTETASACASAAEHAVKSMLMLRYFGTKQAVGVRA